MLASLDQKHCPTLRKNNQEKKNMPIPVTPPEKPSTPGKKTILGMFPTLAEKTLREGFPLKKKGPFLAPGKNSSLQKTPTTLC